jgi:hypothetical protein
LRYVASKTVTLFNDVIAAEILWMRRKFNALEAVADKLPNGTMCKITGAQLIKHLTLMFNHE